MHLKYINKIHLSLAPYHFVYSLLPPLIFRFPLLVGLGPVAPTWPWDPKHLYEALFWGLHPARWGSVWLLSTASLYLSSSWFTFFSTLRDLTFHTTIQNSLELVFFTHHFCDLSESVLSSLFPQVGMYFLGKKKSLSILSYETENLWYQTSVSLSVS